MELLKMLAVSLKMRLFHAVPMTQAKTHGQMMRVFRRSYYHNVVR